MPWKLRRHEVGVGVLGALLNRGEALGAVLRGRVDPYGWRALRDGPAGEQDADATNDAREKGNAAGQVETERKGSKRLRGPRTELGHGRCVGREGQGRKCGEHEP